MIGFKPININDTTYVKNWISFIRYFNFLFLTENEILLVKNKSFY